MGLGRSIGRFFGGTKARTEQIQKYNPEQQQLMDWISQYAKGELQDPTTGFDPIANKAREDYRTQEIPYLSERFASMGQGAGRSSGFRAALQSGSQGLDTNLAAQRAQYGLQNRSLIQQLLGMGLGQRFDSIYQPSKPGFLESSLRQAPGMIMGLGSKFLGL